MLEMVQKTNKLIYCQNSEFPSPSRFSRYPHYIISKELFTFRITESALESQRQISEYMCCRLISKSMKRLSSFK